MHYIDRLIKFIPLFFVFCCFSQVSFGQVDTLLYESFDNGIPNGWTNVENEWTATSGEITFEPTGITTKAELITPSILLENNDSLVVNVNSSFICNSNQDAIYIKISLDGGQTYDKTIYLNENDSGNQFFNLTEIYPDIFNEGDSIVLKFVADLNETLTQTEHCIIDNVVVILHKEVTYAARIDEIDETDRPFEDKRPVNDIIHCISDIDTVRMMIINDSGNNWSINNININILNDSIHNLYNGEEATETELDLPNDISYIFDENDTTYQEGDTISVLAGDTIIWKFPLEFIAYINEDLIGLEFVFDIPGVICTGIVVLQLDDCCSNEIKTFSDSLDLLPNNHFIATTSYIELKDWTLDSEDIYVFQAIDSIVIKPGFETKYGNKFIAYIDSCEVIGVPKKDLSADIAINELSISPNPINNEMKITIKLEKDEITDLIVYDIFGKKQEVIKYNTLIRKGNYIFHIPTNNWSKGMYILKMTNENEEYVKKIIKI